MGIETATLIIAAAGAAATVYQQDRVAKAQTEANYAQRDEEVKAMNENMSQLEYQKQQATAQAGEKEFENNQRARQATATAKVSAGENGVAGLSVDALLAELDGTRARYNDSVSANLTDVVTQADHQRQNLFTSAQP